MDTSETTTKTKVFGLNTYEARIWTALLSRGISTAGELSDIANVPRSRSYDVLEDGAFIAMMTGAQINVAGTAGTTRSAFRQRHRVDELQMVLNFFELLRNRVTD